MANTFSGLARDVFTNEFESNTGVNTFSQISGWFAANVGNLNNLLNTSFNGPDPDIDNEAGAIFKNMYMARYYGRLALNASRGIINSANGENILSVSDGDNKITFANRNEVAKTFRGLKTDLELEIDKAAGQYCMFLSQPMTINGIDTMVSGYTYGGFQTVY
jgi:hypothetical protein